MGCKDYKKYVPATAYIAETLAKVPYQWWNKLRKEQNKWMNGQTNGQMTGPAFSTDDAGNKKIQISMQ